MLDKSFFQEILQGIYYVRNKPISNILNVTIDFIPKLKLTINAESRLLYQILNLALKKLKFYSHSFIFKSFNLTLLQN